MFLLTIIEAFLLLLYVAYLLHQYAQKHLSLYVKTFTLISWLLSFGVVFIIPHDIYYTLTDNTGYESSILLWNIIYWGNFILSWIILPILQEYEDAGEFTFNDKMIRSLKSNLMIYAIGAAVGALFIVYLTAYNKLEWSAVIGLLVGLANGFGVCLLIILLGHGLVAIPRDYWNKAQFEECLKSQYLQATIIDEQRTELHGRLEEQTTLLILLKRSYDSHPVYFEYIESIIAQVPYEFVEMGTHLAKFDVKDTLKTLGCITLNKLAELNRQVKKLSAEYKRTQTKWDLLCQECFNLEDLLENKFSVHYKIRSTLRQPRSGKLGHILDIMIWIWYTRLKRIYLLSLFIIFTTLSTVILLGEISTFTQYDINIMGHLMKQGYGFMHIQTIVLIPLMYIAFCAFYGLFHINFAGMYGFYEQQQTDGPSLMFGSINFSRVSFPLTLNFLQMVKVQNTPFTLVIGNFEQGMSFTLPVLLLLASLFNIFDLYDKILAYAGILQQKCGKSQEDGKKLLCKARALRERELLNMNTESIFRDMEWKQTSKDSYKYFAFQNFEEILKI